MLDGGASAAQRAHFPFSPLSLPSAAAPRPPFPLFPPHNNNPNNPKQPPKQPKPQNHTGSIALGSFIVAVIQFIRFALEYLDRKTKSMQARCLGGVWGVCGFGGAGGWREERGARAVWGGRGALCPTPPALLCSSPIPLFSSDWPPPLPPTRAPHTPLSERNETSRRATRSPSGPCAASSAACGAWSRRARWGGLSGVEGGWGV